MWSSNRRRRGMARCGSVASRRVSQTALSVRMVRERARQGQSSSAGACAMVVRPAAIIRPQEGAGGTTPRPRKESPLSSTTAEDAARLICTSSGPAMLGSTVRARMRKRPAPRTRTAST